MRFHWLVVFVFTVEARTAILSILVGGGVHQSMLMQHSGNIDKINDLSCFSPGGHIAIANTLNALLHIETYSSVRCTCTRR